MKKKLILSAAGVVLLAASVTTFVCANKSNDPMDDLFKANVEALARNEDQVYRNARTEYCGYPEGKIGCVNALSRKCYAGIFCKF